MEHLPFIQDTSLPPGAVVAFAGAVVSQATVSDTNFKTPVEAWGWMVCDGRSLKQSDYPELFEAIGNIYGGSGDEFIIPDLQGMFLRGLSLDQQDAANENRTKASEEGGEENGVGSTQEFALQNHWHGFQTPGTVPSSPTISDGPFTSVTDVSDPQESPPVVHATTTKVQVSTEETRPVNTYVYYLIKYASKLPKPFVGH